MSLFKKILHLWNFRKSNASFPELKKISEINLYDTRTRQTLPLSRIQPVNIYLCGPTVYDDLHIGNIRNVILLDAFTHFLQNHQYSVHYVQNITDISDKIPQKAQTLQMTETSLTEKFFLHYRELFQKLEIRLPCFIKISDVIPDIIDIIQSLKTIGTTYQNENGIYFDVKKWEQQYGVFKKLLPKNFVVMREIADSNKKNSQDFALWKYQTFGQKWNSPWGKGRPGWHTQCVAVISKIFPKGITIHAGGIDLMFPHHENERIQFYAISQKEISQIWMHNGFLNFENQKISKSQPRIRKSFLAKSFVENFSPLTLKIWFLSTPYQNNINFDEKHLNYCQNTANKIIATLKKVNLETFIHLNKIYVGEPNIFELNSFNMFLSQNFDTGKAFNQIFLQVKNINTLLKEKKWKEACNQKITLLSELKLIGIAITLPVFTPSIQNTIRQWQKFVKAKNFTVADQLRKQLQKSFIL